MIWLYIYLRGTCLLNLLKNFLFHLYLQKTKEIHSGKFRIYSMKVYFLHTIFNNTPKVQNQTLQNFSNT